MGSLLQLAESSTEARYVGSGTLRNLDHPLCPCFCIIQGGKNQKIHHMLSITSANFIGYYAC
jgi:hypothetical protein